MMSVIIRLQNLPWTAKAADIRAFFNGLSIPEGGVHIIGGAQGDAFIAFSTDEDARQAMLMNDGELKEVKIKLFLSSRAEMLRVIEQARTLAVQAPTTAPVQVPAIVPTVIQPQVLIKPKEEEEYKVKDDDVSRNRKDRYRSPSRERGRSRVTDSKDRSKDSRDRSRGHHQRDRDNRRRHDRSRSRDRHRSRRSRSRERRRTSREREKDNKDLNRNKTKVSKDVDDDKNCSNSQDESSWSSDGPQIKVPLLPDPPAIPPMLMQMQIHPNGKDIIPPSGPVMNFPHDGTGRPPFAFNPQMGGPMPPQPFMQQMRGREGWGNQPQLMGVMDPMQMGMPRPMMNNGMPPEMGMPGFPPGFMNGPMFPGHNAADPNVMWRPPMLMNTDDVKGDIENDICVEIRGLPLNVSYIDVKKLFDGLSIPSDGIKMINDNHGNRTGIAYVRFSNTSHKKAALNQNGKKVRSNIVEVLHLRDSIYKKAIDNFKPDKDVSLNSVDMDIDSGDNNEDMWPSENKVRGRSKFHDPRMSKSNMDYDDKRTDVIICGGIPPNMTENDLMDFFEEIDVIPVSTFRVFDNMGHPNGNVFCQFKNFEDADKALSKNNAQFGRQVITIKRSRRNDMERARQMQQSGPGPMWQQRPLMQGRPGPPPNQPYNERPQDQERFPRFDERERFPQKDRNERNNGGMEERPSRFRGGGENGMPQMNSRERGAPPMRGGRGARGGMGGGGEHYRNTTPHRGGPPQRRGGPAGQRERSPYIDDTTLEQFGRPGCVVSLENLHFRAEIDEIIEFFDGFNIEHENVIRRFDDSGRPTGDARVALSTPADALRAVRVLNFKMLRGRTVKVSLLQ